MTNPVLIFLVGVYQEAMPIVACMLLVEIGARILKNAFSKGELTLF